MSIFKVTSASIGETKRGFKVFKLQLNNSILATKLFPLKKLDRKYDKLYQMYIEHDSLSFIEGKYISVSINQSQYGYQFSSISSFDALEDFKKEVESSRGKAFSTRLPIYDFLLSLGREVEDDGSIKIKSDFGDMRVSKCNSVSVCYTFNSDTKKLNVGNIERIFNKFYEGVDLPVYSLTGDGQKSYYKISWQDVAIVRMDNHVKVSYKMTTSGDYDKWNAKKVLTIGDDLPDEYVDFLNE
ncbi:hypothetical protein FD722_15645 [Photobacterium damselae subsp. damselae]|uniref:hypothetical protein n=1 Tax=Photobacterium damselae TaxID=38293 RepID=UPI0010FD9F8F|nr:hypothetical protein [Photobacterium damselae]TLS81270.1 hypothetical protein FD719_15575 [Photobacterium damselae subsp. damselae]TLS87967.1 hypothetical protein FD722_15645 [Photobacterium damselae subsp. damselae]